MLLEIQGVGKTYLGAGEDVRALDDVSLSVAEGEFVAVRGPSGCGKTTLLLVAGGLLAPDTGTVQIDGCDPNAISADERAAFRAKNIGFVFQQFHLIPYLNVLENVMAPAIATGLEDASDRARSIIAKLGLEHRFDHVPGQLSAGEKQRTALARAFLNEPRIILADEPTGNLDAENAEIVLGHLKEFVQGGNAVLLVTHSDQAASFAKKTATIVEGRLVN